jgi:acetolactate synthase-1/2/3 large subunit
MAAEPEKRSYERLKVHDVLARAFAAEGVETIVALMGDGNMAFLGSVVGERIDLIQVRHENMAVGMADGYVRAGRPIGVAAVTYGPGLTQIPTSLLVAGRHRSPIVVFAGEPPLSDRYPGSAHEMNQRALVEAAEAGYVSVRSPASAAEDVAVAFHRARAERRPIVIGAAVDLQYSDAPETGRTTRDADRSPAREARGANPDEVARAADALAAARRPLILTGIGALGATAEIERLADLVGANLVTSIAAKGAFAGNPRYLGLAGSFADERTTTAFAEADLVLAVGCGLDPYVSQRGRLLATAHVIQIDIDPQASIASTRQANLLLNGDARLTTGALADALRDRGVAIGHGLPAAFDFAAVDLATFPCDPEPGTLDPRALMAILGDVLPDDCAIVVGAGHFSAFPLLYLPGRRSHRYIPVFDFGSIGQGMPVAFGAALAQPDRPVVAFEGDASLLMNVQELETIGRVRPRLLLFVMNDGALGAEYHRLGRIGIDPDLAAYERADFAAIASAFGVPARTLDTPAGVSDVVDAFFSGDGPLLVDVRASRRSIVPLYRPPAAANS